MNHLKVTCPKLPSFKFTSTMRTWLNKRLKTKEKDQDGTKYRKLSRSQIKKQFKLMKKYPNYGYYGGIVINDAKTKLLVGTVCLRDTFKETSTIAMMSMMSWWSTLEDENSDFILLLNEKKIHGSPVGHLMDYVMNLTNIENNRYKTSIYFGDGCKFHKILNTVGVDIQNIRRCLGIITIKLQKQRTSLKSALEPLKSMWEANIYDKQRKKNKSIFYNSSTLFRSDKFGYNSSKSNQPSKGYMNALMGLPENFATSNIRTCDKNLFPSSNILQPSISRSFSEIKSLNQFDDLIETSIEKIKLEPYFNSTSPEVNDFKTSKYIIDKGFGLFDEGEDDDDSQEYNLFYNKNKSKSLEPSISLKTNKINNLKKTSSTDWSKTNWLSQSHIDFNNSFSISNVDFNNEKDNIKISETKIGNVQNLSTDIYCSTPLKNCETNIFNTTPTSNSSMTTSYFQSEQNYNNNENNKEEENNNTMYNNDSYLEDEFDKSTIDDDDFIPIIPFKKMDYNIFILQEFTSNLHVMLRRVYEDVQTLEKMFKEIKQKKIWSRDNEYEINDIEKVVKLVMDGADDLLDPVMSSGLYQEDKNDMLQNLCPMLLSSQKCMSVVKELNNVVLSEAKIFQKLWNYCGDIKNLDPMGTERKVQQK